MERTKFFKSTSAIIDKNTPEIRERLEKLGYERSVVWKDYDNENMCICTVRFGGGYCIVPPKTAHSKNPRVTWECAGRVCCGTDEEKFFELVTPTEIVENLTLTKIRI